MNGWLILCLALVAMLTINAIASLAAAMLWLAFGQRPTTWPVAARAWMLFALRLSPMLGALAAVLMLFLPSYIAYEPRPADEAVNLKVAIMATIAALGLLITLWRGLTSWWATRQLTAEWLRHAKRVEIDGLDIPAYQFAHPFPVLAIVGVFRPRLFIANRVLDSLDDYELAAAIAHEAAHLRARDNFKLCLIRACRDVFSLFPGSLALDRSWAVAAEVAADERATLAGHAVALHLAAALIKIARLTPEATTPVLPAGAYLFGNDTGGIEYRVRRLIKLAESENNVALNPVQRFRGPRWKWCACFCGIFALSASLAVMPRLLLTVFFLAEQFFSLLR